MNLRTRGGELAASAIAAILDNSSSSRKMDDCAGDTAEESGLSDPFSSLPQPGDKRPEFLRNDDTLLALDRLNELTVRTLHLQVYCTPYSFMLLCY